MAGKRSHFFSALLGGLVVAVVMAMLPAVASTGDALVLGAKNNTMRATRLVSRGGFMLQTGVPGRSVLKLQVAPGTAPLQVNSSGLVANLNADLLDGLEAGAFAVIGHDHDTAYAASGHGHGWADLTTGIPSGLGDGDDDTLGTLTCAVGEVAKMTVGGWVCAADAAGFHVTVQDDTVTIAESTTFRVELECDPNDPLEATFRLLVKDGQQALLASSKTGVTGPWVVWALTLNGNGVLMFDVGDTEGAMGMAGDVLAVSDLQFWINIPGDEVCGAAGTILPMGP